jgi:hypothetical protein
MGQPAFIFASSNNPIQEKPKKIQYPVVTKTNCLYPKKNNVHPNVLKKPIQTLKTKGVLSNEKEFD